MTNASIIDDGFYGVSNPTEPPKLHRLNAYSHSVVSAHPEPVTSEEKLYKRRVSYVGCVET